MNKEPDKKLIEELMRSGYSEAEAYEMAREIRETELYLRGQDRIEPSIQFTETLEARIREELAARTPAVGGHGTGGVNRTSSIGSYSVWFRRVGALAAAVAIVFISIIAFHGRDPEPTPSASAGRSDEAVNVTGVPELWELELVEFEEPALQVDELVISEVLELWTEAEWDIDNLFGKENDHETQIMDYDRICRIGHRYA